MANPKPRTVAAVAKRRRTKARDEAALADLHEAIVDDLDAGVPQKDLVAITGYTRENIRLIAKAVRDRRTAAGHDTPSDGSSPSASSR